MSRRSQRNPSNSTKRKNSHDGVNEGEPPAKMGEIVLATKEQNLLEEKETDELQGNAGNAEQKSVLKDGMRPHFSVVQKRAIEARRRLDSLVKHQQQSLSIKSYMTQLRGDLKKISDQLRSCQRANVRLAKEMEELKCTLERKKPKRRLRKPSSTNRAPKPPPRQQTLVVALPTTSAEDTNQNSDLREVLIGDENQKQIGVDPDEHKAVLENDRSPTSDTDKTTYMSDGNVTFIALNTEEDYPNGSWLGDEDNPQLRVRCHIPPSDMMHVMNMFKSADKVALKLLDLLFDKDTQAMSNISGTGKHNKKKLDPLYMFGLHCHLAKHYGITPDDWHRIKLNIDSKCRTAFRRKVKGLPLYPKQERKVKRSRMDMSSHFTQQCQHLQQVVNQLQTLPVTDGSLAGITIIQEQPDGTTRTFEPGPTGGLVGHTILHHQGDGIHSSQLKEVITQAGGSNEIHLSNGQTIAISQIGELEIQEVDVIKEDEGEPESRVLTFHSAENKKTEKDCALDC